MNPNLAKLYNIGRKEEKTIIGLMSGTSLDGLDIALCRFRGYGLQTKLEVRAFKTVTYDEKIKTEIRKVFAKKIVDLQLLCLLNEKIGLLHGEIILETLAEWKIKAEEIDLIASHGQTIFHAPRRLHQIEEFPNATLQIGDADHLSFKTGIITLSDFRQKHIAAGGEGAPLAVYGDYLLFSQKGEDRIMLNIGGIANFTFLAGDLDATKMFSTDVGPGNTLIDAYTRKYFPEKAYDENGEIASTGRIDHLLLTELKSIPFFEETFPKTTGPELFSMEYVQLAQEKTNTLTLLPEDIIATLTRLSAEGMADAIKKCFQKADNPVVYLSGGGMHNLFLRDNLQQLLPGLTFKDTAELSINPDAKEAVLFATLANESVAAPIHTLGGSIKGVPNVFMGKVSFPQ